MTREDLVLALRVWAHWQAGGAGSLGYPRAAAFVHADAMSDFARAPGSAKLTARGKESRRYGSRAPDDIPDAAAVVDGHLARMQGGDLARLRKALVLRYTHHGPDQVRARICGVGLTRYKELVERGHWYLIGRIED